jgi:hypothetical protein
MYDGLTTAVKVEGTVSDESEVRAGVPVVISLMPALSVRLAITQPLCLHASHYKQVL